MADSKLGQGVGGLFTHYNFGIFTLYMIYLFKEKDNIKKKNSMEQYTIWSERAGFKLLFGARMVLNK